jgi:rhodanese-related sulfurtransferase
MEQMRRRIVKEVCLISMVSIFCGALVNHYSPVGIAFTGSWDTTIGVISANAKNDVVVREREIHEVEAVKKIYDQGNTLFLDSRASEQYEEGHIRDAISFPVRQFDELIETLFEKYIPSQQFITYCSGRDCPDSHELAQQLYDAGYENVKVFIDGYPTWKEKGYPVE